MIAQMLSAIFELITDKPDAVQESTHSKTLIVYLWLFTACTLLGKGLVIKGKSENHIGADHTGV